LLLLLLPLLAGCGAGLKEEGRLPVANPLGRGAGDTMQLTVGSLPLSRNGEVTKGASASYTGTFGNASTDVTLRDARRFIICQRIESARVEVPGDETLPQTITLRNFRLNVTFSDNQATAGFDVSVTGTLVLTRATGNTYSVAVQGSGEEQCLVASIETGNLATLARILTEGGDNTVAVTLTANVTSSPGLPDSTRLILTTGLGTGTLEI